MIGTCWTFACGEGLRNKRIHDDGRRTLGQELLHPGNLTLRVQAAVLDDEGAAVAGGDGSHALELFREARDCIHRRHVADLAPFARCPGRVRVFRGEVRAIWRDFTVTSELAPLELAPVELAALTNADRTNAHVMATAARLLTLTRLNVAISYLDSCLRPTIIWWSECQSVGHNVPARRSDC